VAVGVRAVVLIGCIVGWVRDVDLPKLGVLRPLEPDPYYGGRM